MTLKDVLSLLHPSQGMWIKQRVGMAKIELYSRPISPVNEPYLNEKIRVMEAEEREDEICLIIILVSK